MALKKNNPGCGCCGVVCGNCATGTFPSTVTITYPTGMSQGTCDFSGVNGQSFILPVAPSVLPCYFELENASFDWGVCSPGVTHGAEIVKSGSNYYKYAWFLTSWGLFEWMDTTSHPSPVDCTATTALQCISHGFGEAYWN